uniref:myb family transcription factor APL-like isoform X2 n=1 Tax=Fragaria vesca subsp. vesca TaxID=101020 RepID=UPI0005CB2DD5|nr:PREDICTED: myb family transcription factor APL-like isoform X2 [Fragaria vesca subsp. vesca]
MFGCEEEQGLQGPRAPNMDHGVAEGEEEEEEVEQEESSNDHSDSHIKPVAPPYVPPCYKLNSRLRWTSDLHASFLDAVSQLGGPHKATPKSIMHIMGVQGLTLFQVKSHLQKYRLGKYGMKEWREGSSSRTVSQVLKRQETVTSTPSLSLLLPHENEINELSQELERRKEAQEKLRLRNEVQKHLQLRQEAQSRYLSRAVENACEKLAHQFLGGCAADYAGVFEQNAAGVEIMGSKPHQKDLHLNPAYHMTQTMQLSFENQIASSQPPSEAHFATGDHLISDEHSRNSSVQHLLTFKIDVNREDESLVDDPAEAYLILDTSEMGSGKS